MKAAPKIKELQKLEDGLYDLVRNVTQARVTEIDTSLINGLAVVAGQLGQIRSVKWAAQGQDLSTQRVYHRVVAATLILFYLGPNRVVARLGLRLGRE